MTLSVQPQTVTEGAKVLFICSASANPEITGYRYIILKYCRSTKEMNQPVLESKASAEWPQALLQQLRLDWQPFNIATRLAESRPVMTHHDMTGLSVPRWSKGGVPISEANGDSLEVTVDYSYFTDPVSCEVSNSVGSTNVSTLVDVQCKCSSAPWR